LTIALVLHNLAAVIWVDDMSSAYMARRPAALKLKFLQNTTRGR